MADIDEIHEEINNDTDPYSCFICGKAILPQDRYMVDMAEYQYDNTFREEN